MSTQDRDWATRRPPVESDDAIRSTRLISRYGPRNSGRWTTASVLSIIALFLIGIVNSEDLHFISSSREPRGIHFGKWINQTQSKSGMFLNHSSYTEGEVLLFKTKKNRYRAIPVMGHVDGTKLSKFNDALTFKEWLVKVYTQEKAVKVSVRTTDVVRPVMLHLHASRDRFRAPIIIHADTFESDNSIERAVDPAVFIDTAKKLLPEAIISIGWTNSLDHSAINKLDWTQTFRLIEYVYDLQQPLILNMRLNDAIHSSEQLEWLLEIEKPSIYLVVKGEVTDFVDKWQPLSSLTALATEHKLLFDVDDTWRLRLGQVGTMKKGKRSVEPESWHNLAFPNPFAMLSTSIVSTNGVAFVGWPNSLLISNKRSSSFPSTQRITGRIRFLSKRQIRDISPAKRSGLLVHLFEIDPSRLNSPTIPNSIRIFIGYDGRVTIENREPATSRKQRRRTSNASANVTKDLYSVDTAKHLRKEVRRERFEKATAQLPAWPCYSFDIVDRIWRVELEVWSEKCEDAVARFGTDSSTDFNPPPYHTFLQLETPVSSSRQSRHVAIGKSGDGAIDFLVQELRHSESNYLQVCFIDSLN
ncbi:hypothetical protein M3Y98_00176700 [Aphelenchoides besseyi]|nr:hypothetical protein M3Y98_00176700 [Aphelenchoides besseyi]